MAWQSYGLDQSAQKLVLMARERDPQSLNQSYKMRMAVPYGLERFWGEHLRFQGKEQDKNKAYYWKDTWNELVKVMAKTGVTIPNDQVDPENTKQIQDMSIKLWKISIEDQRVSLAVLTQLCDSIVWWTQRYK